MDPENREELRLMLDYALKHDGPYGNKIVPGD